MGLGLTHVLNAKSDIRNQTRENKKFNLFMGFFLVEVDKSIPLDKIQLSVSNDKRLSLQAAVLSLTPQIIAQFELGFKKFRPQVVDNILTQLPKIALVDSALAQQLALIIVRQTPPQQKYLNLIAEATKVSPGIKEEVAAPSGIVGLLQWLWQKIFGKKPAWHDLLAQHATQTSAAEVGKLSSVDAVPAQKSDSENLKKVETKSVPIIGSQYISTKASVLGSEYRGTSASRGRSISGSIFIDESKKSSNEVSPRAGTDSPKDPYLRLMETGLRTQATRPLMDFFSIDTNYPKDQTPSLHTVIRYLTPAAISEFSRQIAQASPDVLEEIMRELPNIAQYSSTQAQDLALVIVRQVPPQQAYVPMVVAAAQQSNAVLKAVLLEPGAVTSAPYPKQWRDCFSREDMHAFFLSAARNKSAAAEAHKILSDKNIQGLSHLLDQANESNPIIFVSPLEDAGDTAYNKIPATQQLVTDSLCPPEFADEELYPPLGSDKVAVSSAASRQTSFKDDSSESTGSPVGSIYRSSGAKVEIDDLAGSRLSLVAGLSSVQTSVPVDAKESPVLSRAPSDVVIPAIPLSVKKRKRGESSQGDNLSPVKKTYAVKPIVDFQGSPSTLIATNDPYNNQHVGLAKQLDFHSPRRSLAEQNQLEKSSLGATGGNPLRMHSMFGNLTKAQQQGSPSGSVADLSRSHQADERSVVLVA